MSKKKQTGDPSTLYVHTQDNEEQDLAVARTFLQPTVNCALSIKECYKSQDSLSVLGIRKALSDQLEKLHNGEMKRAEAMLLTQAHTLDTLFSTLLIRSQRNMGDYFPAAEKYMKLALKAQSQCRTTIEALHEMKNPRPYIQNNKAQYQQVNNGEQASRARENEKQSNELLEDNSHEWMDTVTPQEAGRDDKELETVGKEHGSQD